jgi:hypothetical protein
MTAISTGRIGWQRCDPRIGKLLRHGDPATRSMTDRSWKSFERRLARDVGQQRIPVTGERAGADFEDGMFSYQAKLGRKMPAYLREWLTGIQGAREGKIGVVVWKPKYAEDAGAVVLLAWRDWIALHRGSDE